MSDFIVAIGLVFVIEGLIFAAFPSSAKRAMMSVMDTPDGALRVIGVVSAAAGVLLVWAIRG